MATLETVKAGAMLRMRDAEYCSGAAFTWTEEYKESSIAVFSALKACSSYLDYFEQASHESRDTLLSLSRHSILKIQMQPNKYAPYAC